MILRFDIVLKANLVPLLDRARLIGPSATSGFRFLFREMPSDIRAFPRLLAMLTATSTRNFSSSSSWWLSSPEPPLRRVSDVLHALSFDVLHCLLAHSGSSAQAGTRQTTSPTFTTSQAS